MDDDTAALTGALAVEKAAAVAGAVASACTAGVAIAQTIHVSNLAGLERPHITGTSAGVHATRTATRTIRCIGNCDVLISLQRFQVLTSNLPDNPAKRPQGLAGVAVLWRVHRSGGGDVLQAHTNNGGVMNRIRSSASSIGGVIGWPASIVMKTNAEMGLIANILVGIVGSALGFWLAGVLGIAPAGGVLGFVVGIAGAVSPIFILSTSVSFEKA